MSSSEPEIVDLPSRTNAVPRAQPDAGAAGRAIGWQQSHRVLSVFSRVKAHYDEARSFLDRLGQEIPASVMSGVSDLESKLPSILVVGDQETGKSSVLQALSGVCLPTGEEITSRMAVELHLRRVPGAEWNTTLTLRWHDAVALDEAEPRSAEEKAKVEQVARGDNGGRFTFEHKAAIGERIMAVQTALAEGVRIITDATIVLEVCGAMMPSLNLVDLPGLQAEGHPQAEAIKQFVRSRVSPPGRSSDSTIVLHVHDFGRSLESDTSASLVRDHKRVMSVITKSDVNKGTPEQKRALVRKLHSMGQQKRMGVVFTYLYCQPLHIDEVRARERYFFDGKMPSNGVDVQNIQRSDSFEDLPQGDKGTANIAARVEREVIEAIYELVSADLRPVAAMREALENLKYDCPDLDQAPLELERLLRRQQAIFSFVLLGTGRMRDKSIRILASEFKKAVDISLADWRNELRSVAEGLADDEVLWRHIHDSGGYVGPVNDGGGHITTGSVFHEMGELAQATWPSATTRMIEEVAHAVQDVCNAVVPMIYAATPMLESIAPDGLRAVVDCARDQCLRTAGLVVDAANNVPREWPQRRTRVAQAVDAVARSMVESIAAAGFRRRGVTMVPDPDFAVTSKRVQDTLMEKLEPHALWFNDDERAPSKEEQLHVQQDRLLELFQGNDLRDENCDRAGVIKQAADILMTLPAVTEMHKLEMMVGANVDAVTYVIPQLVHEFMVLGVADALTAEELARCRSRQALLTADGGSMPFDEWMHSLVHGGIIPELGDDPDTNLRALLSPDPVVLQQVQCRSRCLYEVVEMQAAMDELRHLSRRLAHSTQRRRADA